MPGVVMFGRRWGIASDDFVYPAASEILFRAIWLIALSVVLGVHYQSFADCHNYLLGVYYITMISVLTITIVTDVIVLMISSRGSIKDEKPRKCIVPLLYIKLLMYMFEIIWTGFGTTWAFFYSSTKECPWDVVVVARCAVVIGWLLLFFLLGAVIVVFDPVGGLPRRRPVTDGDEGNDRVMITDEVRFRERDHYQRIWKMRCRLICCCCCQCMESEDNTTSAYEDISHLLTNYFSDMDYVATDIAAGLILVQQQQNIRRSLQSPVQFRLPLDSLNDETLSDTRTPEPSVVEPLQCFNGEHNVTSRVTRPAQWMSVKNASHYMKFALGSYGWMFYVFDNKMTGPGRICVNSRCCVCSTCCTEGAVRGDNCIDCNTTAVILQTKIKRSDILYIRLVNKIYETPFYVAFDHETSSIVVSIRGTLSLSDALTDMSAKVDSMEVPGVSCARAHKGILKAALQTKHTIQRKQLLETALSQHPDYKVVITGHSLGAGTAAVLAILMKDEYPDLICFAYSPPGWLVSESLSRYAEDFVCSVVLGNDLVPRMGLVTFHRLKTQMVRMIEQSQTPKYKILASGFWQTLCACTTSQDSSTLNNSYMRTDSNGDGMRSVSSVNERQPLLVTAETRSEPLRAQASSNRYTEGQNSSEAADPDQAVVDITVDDHVTSRNDEIIEDTCLPDYITCPLYMPGHILYIVSDTPSRSLLNSLLSTVTKNIETRIHDGTPRYQAGWSSRETFDEIIVDSTMLTDHVPHNVYKALLSLSDTQSIVQQPNPAI